MARGQGKGLSEQLSKKHGFLQANRDIMLANKTMPSSSTAAFTLDEALKASWASAKKNWTGYLTIIGVVMLMYIAVGVGYGFLQHVLGLPHVLESILYCLLGVYIYLVMAKGTLMLVRGQKLDLSAMVQFDGQTLIQAIIASLLFYLMVMVGLVLLIVPGIIVAIMFSFYIYTLVDKRIDAIPALEDSMNMTKGNKLTIFVYGIVLGLAGMVAVAIPAVILFALANATSTAHGSQMSAMVLAGIVVILVTVVVALGLGIVSMAGHAWMYLKMRAKTPLHVKK